MSPADAFPDHPMIATRRAIEARQRDRHRRFEPVAVPGDRKLAGRIGMALAKLVVCAVSFAAVFLTLVCWAAMLWGQR